SIDVRLSATATGGVTGNITDTSTGATDKDVAVSGTVSQAQLTITAKDESKTYGNTFTPDGTTQFSTSGLVNGDSVSSVTLSSNGSAAAATVAGSPSAIAASAAVFGAGSASNYAITYVNGALTVNKAHLTVTADDQSKTYDGAASTAFTASLSGFVNGDG